MLKISRIVSTTIEASLDEPTLVDLGSEILILFGVDEEAFPFLFYYRAKPLLSNSSSSKIILTHQ